MSEPVYLDFNATTPLAPEVLEAMLPWLREGFGNPSSGHVYGQRAKAAVAGAREQVAALIGCTPAEIIFTSGGTESNNLAIRGVADSRPERKVIVTTIIEHPATEQPCAWLQRQGWQVIRLPVDAQGVVRVDQLGVAMSSKVALVSAMHSNNETGVVQPIVKLASAAHSKGALLHCDAAQSVGKVPVKVDDLGVDLLSIAGHKLCAPKGVGALYLRAGLRLEPFARGAGQENGLRPGTENVASIVGLGAACALAGSLLAETSRRVQGLRDRLWAKLSQGVPGLQLNGHQELRLPNTLNARFPGVTGAAVLAGAPGVAASTGSACHSGEEKASAVILAMGVSEREALGSVRLTLGRSTTAAEVDAAGEQLVAAWSAAVKGKR
jgi:cysteine desulfurase